MTEPLFKVGDACPCCGATFKLENDFPGSPDSESYVLCPECGYCPEDEFDGRINDCPSCKSYSHIINQGNIVCSGCGLELTADDEETAIKQWNGMKR